MDFLPELAKNGLLALLLAISMSLNFFLGKLLLYEKDKRIAEAEKVRDELVRPMGFIKESLELIEKKVEISKELNR